jgi:hypothetical protein
MSTATGDPVGQPASTTASLSGWAAPYVTGMLAKGEALANQPYQAYSGPLTAGQSGLQTQAFQGLGALTVPTAQMGGFTPTSFTSGTTAQDYMSPFMSAALEPQIAEAQRQAEIQRVQNASRLGKAGAYGGSRQAIMESEGQRNLLRNLADIYGTGMQQAYTQGMGQFNTEQDRARQAQEMTNRYGLTALGAQQLVVGNSVTSNSKALRQTMRSLKKSGTSHISRSSINSLSYKAYLLAQRKRATLSLVSSRKLWAT